MSISDCVCAYCVVQALGMSGQKLFGVPIMLQPTMAEKNRCAVVSKVPVHRDNAAEHTNSCGSVLHFPWPPSGLLRMLRT